MNELKHDINTKERASENEGALKIFLSEAGGISIFTAKLLRQTFSFPTEFKEFLRQCYETGNRSLPLVCITGFIMDWC
jgi:ABC-type transporter Mla maintaining outer membrane lipid asymmetry permease subunit MlaE